MKKEHAHLLRRSDGLREVLHEVRRANRDQLGAGRAQRVLEIVQTLDRTGAARQLRAE